MSNLKQFKAEVSGLGAEACLPKNLPEYWFQYISNSLDGVIEDVICPRFNGQFKRLISC